MVTVGTAEPLAVAVVDAICSGDLATLQRLLTEHPWLATAEPGDDDPGGMQVGLQRVALLMRTHGLAGCHRRPATVAHPPIPDVSRRAHRRGAHRRLLCEYRQLHE